MDKLEDHDFTLHYHPDKENVVVDALNRKSWGVLVNQCGFPRVIDAQGCGIFRAALQGSGSGYFGEFSGYAIPTEQSDRVRGT